MNWRRIFSGVPDGLGRQEDPGYLCPLYAEFEAVCFVRADPRTVGPSRVWFPIGNHLEHLDLSLLSRWQMAQRVFEGYRFGEAGLAAVQIVSGEWISAVSEVFSQLPEHLQTRLFDVEVEDQDLPMLKEAFRKAFRLAWYRANNDEAVHAWLDIEKELFERMTAADAPSELLIEGDRIDLAFEARKTSYLVNQALRSAGRGAERLEAMAACQSALEDRRHRLTAMMKVVTDAANRK